MGVPTKVTEHVYWLPPAPPDRPSLCAVVGDRRTLMLDAGSSAAHTAAFLDALSAEGVPRPSAVVYTHSDWDHVLGGVSVAARHVGGDHNPESSVMFVEPDRLLFLGDCLGTSSEGGLTAESAFRVRDAILGFDAEHYVEGHHEAVSSRREMDDLFRKMELAERAVREELVIAAPDEDTAYFLQAFELGRALAD
jgi:glyoxylase-like metal-dependent hydrolase (beta-lactamase superfamily II)